MLSKHARWMFSQPMARIAVWLKSVGVTPNAVTLTGFLLTVLSALFIARGQFIIGGLLLSPAALLDMLDGTLARLTKPSIFGAFLDSTLDRYSESVVLLALAYHYVFINSETEVVLIFFILVGSLMVSYTRARAEGLNVECKVGLLQRPERVVLVIVGLFFSSTLMLPVLWILATLTNFTTLQRIYEVYWRTNQTRVGVPPRE